MPEQLRRRLRVVGAPFVASRVGAPALAALLLCVGVVAGAGEAAAEIVPLEQHRWIMTEYEAWDECCEPEPVAYSYIQPVYIHQYGAGAWEKSYSYQSQAWQRSDVGPDGILGQGTASEGYDDWLDLQATSALSVTFEVDAAGDFALTGTLTEARLALRSSAPGAVPDWSDELALEGVHDLDLVFSLLPGTLYQLEVEAAAKWIPRVSLPPLFQSEAAFDVAFVPVPEPSTALLLASAAGLLARRRALLRR